MYNFLLTGPSFMAAAAFGVQLELGYGWGGEPSRAADGRKADPTRLCRINAAINRADSSNNENDSVHSSSQLGL